MTVLWPKFLTSTCVAFLALRLVLLCGAALAESAPPARSQAPISLNAALRLSIEDGLGFIEKMPSWLASDYANAHPQWRQELLWRAGRAAWMLSKTVEQLQFSDQLEALSVSASLPTAKAYALILRARYRQESGDYRSGVNLVTQAATILNTTQRPEAAALADMEFCAAYYSGEQTALAVRACERVEKTLANLPALPADADTWSYAQSDRVWLQANTENYTFITAERTERNQVDLRRAKHAIALFTALKMPTMVSMVQDNLSTYYLENGDAAKALSLSQSALKLELAQGRDAHAISSLINIGNVQSSLGQHALALAAIEQALSLAKKNALDSSFSSIYEQQMQLAEAAGDLPLALAAARQAITAKSTAFDEHNARAIAEMDARFQGAEQTRQIENLAQERKIRQLELETSKAENAQQSARLSRKNLLLWLVTVSTLALLLVSTLLWVLWRASQRHASRMRWLADIDGLTQLLNRRAFVEQFSQSLQQLARSGGHGALCILDIDHFKQINDTHGHPVGDLALKRIAELIRTTPNATSAATGTLLGRLGGEEFAIWLPNTDSDDAWTLAEQLRKRIAEDHQRAETLGFTVSASIGIAALPATFANSAYWLSAADRALYRAKHLGRNRCERAPVAEEESKPTSIGQSSPSPNFGL